ncbi:putative 23S rRNA (guanine-N(1)-)-methyltransferase [Frankia canadensis]|uniref:Putative 23S rRNA (Guanine-N(1)-)-methyltransferase n=1 Tax=Frankia canadensis TaxID=1836972 RepID=A0A2I2KJP6_9ACTN|nr:methyltransferase domain-containing protein [Frankia canadensis]SNQ45876.1 putative 23S rRNA (guanine-N(1)-)-methyltransferase [Frankia canadensis]SOU53166.1 putative 23S rRNA (guanine-N(1)-)-methyltransferase [Frankia canadensis]
MTAEPGAGLAAILPVLRCPVCAGALVPAGADGAGAGGAGGVRCPAGHGFDVGRGGYLSLRGGRARRVTGDTAEMVAAREAFLGAGHYRPLTARLGELAAGARAGEAPGTVPVLLEIGAGTGHHLAGVLAALPADALGVAADVSPPALRRAARAHPRIGAVAFDAAGAWPVRDGSVGVLLDVFAPRHPDEMRRVLRPGGQLLIVTPAPGHLGELRGPLGLVGMQAGKADRLDERMTGRFTADAVECLDVPLSLSVDEAVDLALMGPTGHHRTPADLRARAAAHWAQDTVQTIARFQLHPFRPR